MDKIKTQVVVIGSGPGGYVAAIRLAQLGQQVVCVEKDSTGGVCLNIGCIPSKALISASKNYHKIDQLGAMGIEFADKPKLNVDKLQEWKAGIVKKLTSGIESLFVASGVKKIEGIARIETPHRIIVDGKNGPLEITTDSVIIATGSLPIELQGITVDNQRILNSTGALALKQVPQSLLVIGGGYIGLELGMMWASFGAKVTFVEYGSQLLPGMDSDLVVALQKKMTALGIEVLLEHQAISCQTSGKRVKAVITDRKSGASKNVQFEYVLSAVGRVPNSTNIGLEKIGVQTDAKGFVLVNSQQQTSVPGIYAIGDVCGQPMLAHKASKEGEIAAENIVGHRAVMDVRTIPAVVFTQPEIASVGLSESAAKQAGYDVLVGKYSFAALGRAMASLETDGFVKIVGDKATRVLLGVHIIGPAATDLISEAALALEMGCTLDDLALTIHPHPTLGEALMEAAKVALNESAHVVQSKKIR